MREKPSPTGSEQMRFARAKKASFRYNTGGDRSQLLLAVYHLSGAWKPVIPLSSIDWKIYGVSDSSHGTAPY